MYLSHYETCLFFFACPKKNQKRTPENETARFRGGICIKLLYYCGELLQSIIHQTANCLLLMAISQQLKAILLAQKRSKKRHPQTKLPVLGWNMY